jgi:hypothetical protein
MQGTREAMNRRFFAEFAVREFWMRACVEWV